MVLADTQGILRHWNAGAQRPHTARAAVGQSLDRIVPEAYRQRHRKGFHEAMRTGICRLNRAATNLPTLLADGRTRVLAARFVLLADAHGRPPGAVVPSSPAVADPVPFTPVAPTADRR